MSTLNLFPSRVAIGTVQQNGDVLMTPEFFRALTDLLKRVGGTSAPTADELEALFSIETSDVGSSVAGSKADNAMLAAMFDMPRAVADQCCDPVPSVSNDADVAVLSARIEALEVLLAQHVNTISAASQAQSYAQYVEIEYAFGPPPVDWEHPGKIGAQTANSGAFTTLTASAAVTLSPANANVVISPTGTGLVTISPDAAGTIDNIALGGTTARAGRMTNLRLTDTAGGASTKSLFFDSSNNYALGIGPTSTEGYVEYHSGTGSTAVFGHRWYVNGTERFKIDGTGLAKVTGSFQVTTGFGCNGKTAQTAFALGAAATDLPTVITLANNLRTMSINNGIGS